MDEYGYYPDLNTDEDLDRLAHEYGIDFGGAPNAQPIFHHSISSHAPADDSQSYWQGSGDEQHNRYSDSPTPVSGHHARHHGLIASDDPDSNPFYERNSAKYFSE